jgi:SAM-dependent methyltransferase
MCGFIAVFDRVVCTLLLHHLTRENKVRTLNEVFRVLRPGGELHVADFGKPQNALMYTISLVTRRFEEAADNVAGFLTELFWKAGFDAVEETARYMTIMGTLALYRAKKPA